MVSPFLEFLDAALHTEYLYECVLYVQSVAMHTRWLKEV